MTEIERILIHPNGKETRILLSQVGPNLFRVESGLGFIEWGWDEGEIPEDVAMGWLIEADRIDESRLRLRDIRPDPQVETLSLAALPWAFPESQPFAGICEQIMMLGGNWEVIMGGMFSAWVPRETSREVGFELRGALNTAVERWANERRSDSRDLP